MNDAETRHIAEGRGKWSQVGVPHSGWHCVETEDLEEPLEICEMCEVQQIRYVHVMTHPEFPEPLRCGCICAGHMEQDRAAAVFRERELKSVAARRQRWLKRTWRTSHRGNEFLNVGDFNIAVFRSGRWRFRIACRNEYSRHAGFARTSRKGFDDKDSAKLAALEALIFMEKHNS